MSERHIQLGVLAESRTKKMELAAECEGLIRGIRTIILPASTRPLAELDVHAALELMNTLHDRHNDFMAVSKRIENLKAELGER